MNTYEKAKRIAARYIAARMYTCREIEDRLRRKGIELSIAEQVVSEFAEAGILDDRLYAETYVSQAVKLCGKGMYRIKQELYAKGIAKSIADSVFEESDGNTFEALCEYVESRRLHEGIKTRRDYERLRARLARRGFSPCEIKECLNKYEFNFED